MHEFQQRAAPAAAPPANPPDLTAHLERYACPICGTQFLVADAPPGAERLACDRASCRTAFWAIDAITPELGQCARLGMAPATAAAWAANGRG